MLCVSTANGSLGRRAVNVSLAGAHSILKPTAFFPSWRLPTYPHSSQVASPLHSSRTTKKTGPTVRHELRSRMRSSSRRRRAGWGGRRQGGDRHVRPVRVRAGGRRPVRWQRRLELRPRQAHVRALQGDRPPAAASFLLPFSFSSVHPLPWHSPLRLLLLAAASSW